MLKRSLTSAGHRTAKAREPECWSALEELALERGLTLPHLVREIDQTRDGPNLSSALRVAVLNRWRPTQAS